MTGVQTCALPICEAPTSTTTTTRTGPRARSVPITPNRTADLATGFDVGTGAAALSALGFTGSSLFSVGAGDTGPLLLPGIAEGDLGFGEEPAVALPMVPGAERVVPAGATTPTPSTTLPLLAVLIALTTLGGAAAGHARALRSRVAIRFTR